MGKGGGEGGGAFIRDGATNGGNTVCVQRYKDKIAWYLIYFLGPNKTNCFDLWQIILYYPIPAQAANHYIMTHNKCVSTIKNVH